MRIRCLLGFSTMLSSNMAMKMIYGALNFDSHTLNILANPGGILDALELRFL